MLFVQLPLVRLIFSPLLYCFCACTVKIADQQVVSAGWLGGCSCEWLGACTLIAWVLCGCSMASLSCALACFCADPRPFPTLRPVHLSSGFPWCLTRRSRTQALARMRAFLSLATKLAVSRQTCAMLAGPVRLCLPAPGQALSCLSALSLKDECCYVAQEPTDFLKQKFTLNPSS